MHDFSMTCEQLLSRLHLEIEIGSPLVILLIFFLNFTFPFFFLNTVFLNVRYIYKE